MSYDDDIYGLTLAARALLAAFDYGEEMENLELGLPSLHGKKEGKA